MIADIDKDGSGTIDFEEFLQMMTAKMGERDSKVILADWFDLQLLQHCVLDCGNLQIVMA